MLILVKLHFTSLHFTIFFRIFACVTKIFTLMARSSSFYRLRALNARRRALLSTDVPLHDAPSQSSADAADAVASPVQDKKKTSKKQPSKTN